ncbi:MAG: hypothetical protein C3F12_02145 [Candidatus Methylomirabilota bacterium]|nr:hypothetical protein [candidate division NC10 bacterium]PWB48581.1 MAG: hypothetical protein C3F12_02145 [candidate division NC10 bacterium]
MGKAVGTVKETPADTMTVEASSANSRKRRLNSPWTRSCAGRSYKVARGRRLRNISIKLDPAQIQALKKIATIQSIPYQTLIRQWLAEGIRQALHLTAK